MVGGEKYRVQIWKATMRFKHELLVEGLTRAVLLEVGATGN